MPQLDISTFPSQIFWLVVCFAVLCFAMVTFLVPRMGQTMAARTATLEELHKKTDKLLLEAEELNRSNAERLQAAKKSAHSKVNQALSDLSKFKEETVHHFEVQLQKQINDTQYQLTQHKQEILALSSQMREELIRDMYQKLTKTPLDTAQMTSTKNLKKKEI